MTHFIFVDFENVQKVDLDLIEGKPVHVTFLLGKAQTWLDLKLVQQIRRLPDQVELVEVGGSGHNALDLTLACYLGRALERQPDAHFAIVSKDKDFGPMVAHLQANGIKAERHDTFAGVSFLHSARPARTVKAPSIGPVADKVPAPARDGVVKKPAKPKDYLPKFIAHLKRNPTEKKANLVHMIEAQPIKQLGVDAVIEELKRRKIIAIEGDRIAYL